MGVQCSSPTEWQPMEQGSRVAGGERAAPPGGEEGDLTMMMLLLLCLLLLNWRGKKRRGGMHFFRAAHATPPHSVQPCCVGRLLEQASTLRAGSAPWFVIVVLCRIRDERIWRIVTATRESRQKRCCASGCTAALSIRPPRTALHCTALQVDKLHAQGCIFPALGLPD